MVGSKLSEVRTIWGFAKRTRAMHKKRVRERKESLSRVRMTDLRHCCGRQIQIGACTDGYSLHREQRRGKSHECSVMDKPSRPSVRLTSVNGKKPREKEKKLFSPLMPHANRHARPRPERSREKILWPKKIIKGRN